MIQRHGKPPWEKESSSYPNIENIGTAFLFNNMTEAHTVCLKIH